MSIKVTKSDTYCQRITDAAMLRLTIWRQRWKQRAQSKGANMVTVEITGSWILNDLKIEPMGLTDRLNARRGRRKVIKNVSKAFYLSS